MKFSAAIAALFAALAQAKVFLSNGDYTSIQPGKPFTIMWSGQTGPVTLTLKSGPTTNLNTVLVISSNDAGQTFTWTPPASLPSGTYAIEIKDSADTNYSPQFTFVGSASAVSSSTQLPSLTSNSASSTSNSAQSTSTSQTTTTTTGTSTTTSRSTSSSSTGSQSRTATPSPTNSNDSPRVKSQLALVAVGIAALAYFN